MNKALITAAGPHMAEVLGYSEPTFREFADQHDYDLIVSRDVVDEPRHHDILSRAARWAKVGLMERYLQTHDLVVWMDADIMITQFDKDIADDVPEDSFQALVLEEFPDRTNPNTGVWAMRRLPESRSFLNRVREIGQLAHVWADQAAVCTALGWELRTDVPGKGFLGSVELVKPTEHIAGTAWLPGEWNPLGAAADLPYRAWHFAGMANEDRIPAMNDLSQRLQAEGLITV